MRSRTDMRAQLKAGVEPNRHGARMVLSAGMDCRKFGESGAESWRSGVGRWTAEAAHSCPQKRKLQNGAVKQERKWSRVQLCGRRINVGKRQSHSIA